MQELFLVVVQMWHFYVTFTAHSFQGHVMSIPALCDETVCFYGYCSIVQIYQLTKKMCCKPKWAKVILIQLWFPNLPAWREGGQMEGHTRTCARSLCLHHAPHHELFSSPTLAMGLKLITSIACGSFFAHAWIPEAGCPARAFLHVTLCKTVHLYRPCLATFAHKTFNQQHL